MVRDFSSLENGQPREGVFVEMLLGKAVLRPLGETTPHQRVDPAFLRSLDPREIAPGTWGNPRRRPL
ncbi:hypothetical protein [Kitasatospora cathayae]|uniref:Uncharacterized protein n=1 Tax=Kitasatospora cathayae TaxID=3004092 RepID=A0ABY7QEF0_9ACTN|nr:hypothetical protein [Kitasatospora sp. HUAS 3-15]WBP91093.1 hypothetical protein O1G21_37955 [Kitasatospora sp. HUAS 3-15]